MRLILCLLALLLSSQQRLFRCGGYPSRTQVRNSADELHRNRFGEWEMVEQFSLLQITRASTAFSPLAARHSLQRDADKPAKVTYVRGVSRK